MMISSLTMLLVATIPNSTIAAASPSKSSVALSQQIDSYVEKASRTDGIRLPAIVSDDLFLRRISLDLLGRIPTRDELLQFRANPDRARAVALMLEHQDFAKFWSRVWTANLIGYSSDGRTDREALRQWLELKFASETSLDEIAAELISSEGKAAFDGSVNFMLRHAQDPVVPVGRIFLGVQLDCARCHDHPFDRWTQQDFEGMRRFFSRMRPRQVTAGDYELRDARGEGEKPQFLTGRQPRTGRWRQELALMITQSKPFGRAMANRLWYHFMGRGIGIEPDSVNGDNRSEHQALIESLAGVLRDSGYQLKPIILAICNSKTYQRRLSSSDPDWPL
ncbi:MAG: DUF1549 domain-containing protein, partial [Planctomycetota bacterium]